MFPMRRHCVASSPSITMSPRRTLRSRNFIATPVAARATNLRTMPLAAETTVPTPSPLRDGLEVRVAFNRTRIVTFDGARDVVLEERRAPARVFVETGSGKCQVKSPSWSTNTTALSTGDTSTSTEAAGTLGVAATPERADGRTDVFPVGAIVNSSATKSSWSARAASNAAESLVGAAPAAAPRRGEAGVAGPRPIVKPRAAVTRTGFCESIAASRVRRGRRADFLRMGSPGNEAGSVRQRGIRQRAATSRWHPNLASHRY